MPDFTDPLYALAKRWADDAYNVRPSDVPAVVYHYTDAAGLVGMLNNGRVWATDYRFLNDNLEVEHTRREVRKIISERLEKDKAAKWRDLYNDVISYQENMRVSDAFVFSLSQERDDLSQWRGYAREGQGFTLGLSGRVLCKSSEADDAEFAFFKVDYNLERQSDALCQALAEIEDYVHTKSPEGSGSKKRLIAKAAEVFYWLTETRAIANKHPSFRSEQEWRVASHLDSEDQKEAKVRSSGARLVRYIELNLEEGGKLPLKEIGIGPGFKGNEEVLAVRTLCKQNGYDPTIYFAETPYRRL